VFRLWWFGVLALLLASCNLASQPPAPTETSVPPQLGLTCDELVAAAIQAVGSACSATARNQACYGNNLVDAELRAGAQARFTQVGDLAGIENLRLISTSPLDEIRQTWGVALLKAQANLPASLPGQNLTFLLYGGAAADNITPSVEAVVLSTGFGSTTCADAPESAVLLQSPSGTQVRMNLNGASVTLGSTLYITAVPNTNLTIATVTGSAQVEAFGVSRIVPPGAQVRLPLGTDNGLQVIGPPSQLEPFDLDAIRRAPFSLLPEAVQIPAPFVPGPTATVTLPGLPITATLPPVTIPLPPTAIPTVCVPRADWVYTYTVQPGDTLFSIAQRFGLSLAQLQTANCIVNANVIAVGQVLRVPFPLPIATNTPIPAPTNTSRPLLPTSTTIPFFPTNTPTNPNFAADQPVINLGDCTTVRWSVQNVSAVYFNGEPTSTTNAIQVCPESSSRYILLVVYPDGTQVSYFASVTVLPPPTEEVILQ
jgi:hypothetical protein